MTGIHNHRRNEGFTLVELLVATGLFTTAIAIAVGGFVHVLRTQRQVAALMEANSNVNLVLEQMAREIRTGYLFDHDPGVLVPNASSSCTGVPPIGAPPPGGTWVCSNLVFYNAGAAKVDYRLNNGAIEKGVNGTYQPITGANVSVKYLSFVLFGQTEGDRWTPRITMVTGVAPSSSDPAVQNTVLNLQTTVSAREIDCDTSATPIQC